MTRKFSPLEKQVADALRRARRLPIGPHRNDLRQLARGLRWLHRNGMDALVHQRSTDIQVVTAPVEVNHLAQSKLST